MVLVAGEGSSNRTKVVIDGTGHLASKTPTANLTRFHVKPKIIKTLVQDAPLAQPIYDHSHQHHHHSMISMDSESEAEVDMSAEAERPSAGGHAIGSHHGAHPKGQCRDKAGRFVKCPGKKAQCRDPKTGRFIKCGGGFAGLSGSINIAGAAGGISGSANVGSSKFAGAFAGAAASAGGSANVAGSKWNMIGNKIKGFAQSELQQAGGWQGLLAKGKDFLANNGNLDAAKQAAKDTASKAAQDAIEAAKASFSSGSGSWWDRAKAAAKAGLGAAVADGKAALGNEAQQPQDALQPL